MKTMLKSLAAIRTWMVALAVTFLSGATLASELYTNPLASNSATVTSGAYGDIVVPGTGFEATKFTGEFSPEATITGGRGSFAGVISGGAVATHTVSGWFKTDSLNCTVFAALGSLEFNASLNGYKVYCTGEGKLLIGRVNSDTCAWDQASFITVPTELKADTWYYLTIAIKQTTNKYVTAAVFVNGVKIYDSAETSTSIRLNLNGQTCPRFWIGAGVSAAGLYIDSAAVSDAETIKGWATSPELVEAAPTMKSMPANYSQPSVLIVPCGAYANTGLDAKDVTRMVTTFDVNGSDKEYSGAMDESGTYPFACSRATKGGRRTMAHQSASSVPRSARAARFCVISCRRGVRMALSGLLIWRMTGCSIQT